MTKKFKHSKVALALLAVSSAMLLQACGGGGGGNSGAPASAPQASAGTPGPGTNTPTAADEGAVSAKFKVGASSRYLLIGPGSSFTAGRADAATQEGSGAILKLGGNTLGGSPVVKSIQGDENFAMGRWAVGTLTRSSGAETLTGAEARNYHYTAFNPISELPTEGSLQCSASASTAATPDGGSASQTGTASGIATLSFTADGANVAGQLSVSAGGGNTSVTLGASKLSNSGSQMTGAFFNGGAGSLVQVADAGNGAFAVIGAYRAATSGGNYIGVYRLNCK